MIFKETDRDNIRYLTLNVSRIGESTEKLRELRDRDHNEVTAKFDSITNSIDALADKIDALTKATIDIADVFNVFQDFGNAMRAIRDLSKADGEVNKKQFEAIIAGIELITNMLEPKKVVSSCDEVVDDIQVIRVAKARRRRFATVHNRYRTHR